jgi:hypothetical protein
VSKELDHIVWTNPLFGRRRTVWQGLQAGQVPRWRVQDQDAVAGLDEELAGESRFRHCARIIGLILKAG